ncbi:hypothetical protein E3G69_002447 [Mycobacteroides abscessus]|nr:hypothetical protein [Mycobacteroides abscessus]QOF43403.1 hypothetical protein E3G69_002447 [Mycobacteroides abscessus]QOF48102.1 hypothetical protein E3G70_002446 [Mycobacteroides abscessus]
MLNPQSPRGVATPMKQPMAVPGAAPSAEAGRPARGTQIPD